MLTTRLLKRNSFNILRRFYSDDVKPPRGPENPWNKTKRILSNDMKYLGTFFSNKKPIYNHYDSVSHELDDFPYHADIVIIGGGIMGSSIAYFLKERAGSGLEIVVIEKDSTYKNASTVLSVGGLRQQFSLPENILMSQFAAKFFRDIKTNLGDNIDIQFTPHGYLLLATEKTVEQLEKNFELQQELKVENELLSPSQLKIHFPWLNTDGIVLGCRGLANEGWFDPWTLLAGFRKKSMQLGVKYVSGEAIGFDFQLCKNVSVADEYIAPYEKLKAVNVMTAQGVERPIHFSKAILAAGADSGEFARKAKIGCGAGILQVPLPVERRKRYVYCFNCQSDRSPGINTPMTFDPSGTYFRREGLGNNFIAGRAPSPDNEPDTKDLEVDHNFFDTDVWPNLAARVPAFEAVKVTNAWAGFYEFNTFDENGIIGAHPYHNNLIIAAGFSGHGIQQAPAVGRAVAEIILDGQFTTIDLNRLGFDRLLINEPMIETNCF